MASPDRRSSSASWCIADLQLHASVLQVPAKDRRQDSSETACLSAGSLPGRAYTLSRASAVNTQNGML